MKYSTILFSTLMIMSVEDLVAKEVTKEYLQTSLTNCLEISAEGERLRCYDNVAKSLKSTKEAVKAAKSPDLSHTKKSEAQPKTTAKAQLAAKTEDSDRQAINASKKLDDFGKKSEAVPSSISSRLKGEFKKWKKGQKLQLENGQVWVVKRANRGYKKLQNPLITITEDFFGGFTAEVEGLNATAKVRRIK